MADTKFNDKYFPRVDLSDKSRYEYYEYEGKEFAYDKKDCLVLWLFKDDEEVEEMGEDKAPYREMDAVGLRPENWKNKDARDEYLFEWCMDIDEEANYLMQDYLSEFGESCNSDEDLELNIDADDYEPGTDEENDEDLELLVEEDPDEELELAEESVTYGDTARAYDVARYCYDQGMSDRQAVREIQKQLSKEGSVVPAEKDIWRIVDGVYEGDSEYVDEAYTLGLGDAAPIDDYADQINEYIQNHPNKPVMWRLYKENVILPWFGYKIIDVPSGAVSRTVDLLNEMPLVSEKNAKVTMTPYGDDEWSINVRWKEQPTDEDLTEGTIGKRDFFDTMNRARKALKSVNPKKLAYVKKAYDEYVHEYGKYGTDEEDKMNPSQVKNDWMLGAIEDDLMTEEEFNQIFQWLDDADDSAMAYA